MGSRRPQLPHRGWLHPLAALVRWFGKQTAEDCFALAVTPVIVWMVVTAAIRFNGESGIFEQPWWWLLSLVVWGWNLTMFVRYLLLRER